MRSRADRTWEAIFSGQLGAKLAGALLAGGILPVLALLFAFPNGEYFDGTWISVLGGSSALIGWRGWKANQAARNRQAVHGSRQRRRQR